MSSKKEITHRCEGSLANEMSIRYSKQHTMLNISSDYKTWRLFKLTMSDDYNSYYLSHISPIEFCPFCGKRLKPVLSER